MPSTLATFSPVPAVTVDGAGADELAARIQAVVVDESVAGLGRCEIELDNWGVDGAGVGYVYARRDVVDFGGEVEVAMGPPDEQSVVFRGRISGLEGSYSARGALLTVLAEDALQDLRMTRRTRTFEDSTDADIVEAIATAHGLTAHADLDGPTHRAVCQLNQSDLAFLRERALPHGADVWLDGTDLYVGQRDDEPIVLRYGIELTTLRVLADLAQQATEQRVAGWDPDGKEAVLETADDAVLGSELGPDRAGGALLAEAFGDRPATATVRGAVTAAEARATARGLYLQRARRFVTGTGATTGIAALRAGSPVELSGLGAMFDGRYRLARVVHRFDLAGGYRTDIHVERPGVAP